MKTPTIRRKKDGTRNLIWTQPMYGYIRHGLETGLTQQQIADGLGISLGSLQGIIYRRGLNVIPDDVVLLAEMAAAWGVTIVACRRYCLHRGVTVRRVGGNKDAVSREDAERLNAGRAEAVTARPPGHYTAAELAQSWGVCRDEAQRRVRGLPYLNWVRPGIPRWVRVYDLRNVPSPTTLPRSIPSGTLTREEMAAFANRKPRVVGHWAHLGCPHGWTRDGRLYFDPQAVATWLVARGNVLTRRLGTRLLERLTPQERAA